MKRNSLGEVIRKARNAQQLTQRDLGQLVGVKSSHIAYIENGRRNPSLTVLRRIADALVLDSRQVLFLAHPDAKYLVGDLGEGAAGKREKSAWRQFASNGALLKRHEVTRGELRILKQVSLLQHVTHADHFVFILNAIRQAGIRRED